jgi:hypothetical protein
MKNPQGGSKQNRPKPSGTQDMIKQNYATRASDDASLRQKALEVLKLLRAVRAKRQRQGIINKLLADAHGRN